MKNLVVFVTPKKRFFGEYGVLAKVFVDNSLDLGWKPEDLMMVTNFPWEYNGVKATVVSDDNYCAFRPRSIKTSIVPHLAELGLVTEGELYWNHDLDAFQMNKFDLELKTELGLTDYGWKSNWCMGSYFFTESAKDVFSWVRDLIFTDIEDERAVERITKRNTHNINSRITRLNVTYNFGMRRVEENWERAEQPVKVVHFHPTYKLVRTWDVFVLGQNGLGFPLVSDRLLRVFKEHKVGRQ